MIFGMKGVGKVVYYYSSYFIFSAIILSFKYVNTYGQFYGEAMLQGRPKAFILAKRVWGINKETLIDLKSH